MILEMRKTIYTGWKCPYREKGIRRAENRYLFVACRGSCEDFSAICDVCISKLPDMSWSAAVFGPYVLDAQMAMLRGFFNACFTPAQKG